MSIKEKHIALETKLGDSIESTRWYQLLVKFKQSYIGKFIIQLCSALLAIAFIFYFICTPSLLWSTSMGNTFKLKTWFFINNLSYGISNQLSYDSHYYIRWSKPQRDEIVEVDFPEAQIETYIPFVKRDKSLEGLNLYYIKRVVAVGGDKVLMKDGYLYLSCHEGIEYMKQHFKNKEFITIKNETYVKNPFVGYTYMFDTKVRKMAEPVYPHLYNSKEPILIPKDHCFILGDNRWDSVDSRYFGTIPIEWVRGRILDFTITPNI